MTPPSAAAMFVGDHYDAFNLLAGAAAVFPVCTVTTVHLIPSQTGGETDRRTLTS